MRSTLKNPPYIVFLTVFFVICVLVTVNAEPSATSGDGKEEMQKNDDVPANPYVTKEDLYELENKIRKELDSVQIKPRMNERELNRIEEERIDSLYNGMLKAGWAKRLSLSGDIRLRYQNDIMDEDNGTFLKPDDPEEIMNSTENRQRYRARVRLNLRAALIDPRELNVGKVTANIRLSSGSVDDPVSTNETLGDYNNKDSIVLDRYCLTWQYEPELPIWGRIPQVDITGGRMPNPWFSSDLVWDSDLNFEGLTVALLTDTLQSNSWHVFLTTGAYVLQEVELYGDDKWLYGGQLGFEVQPVYGVRFKLGGAYYHYENIVGIVNDPSTPGRNDFSAPIYQQKGNTLIDIDPDTSIKTALASEFQIIDATGLIDITFFYPVHIILEGTYANNIGFDKDKVSERTGIDDVEEDTQAHRFGMKIGYPDTRQFGEFNFSYYYKYLESDAVLDAFTDSDFHLGGTNCEGWILGFEFGLYKNIWLTTRWLTADEIAGPAMSIDIFQFDVNAKF